MSSPPPLELVDEREKLMKHYTLAVCTAFAAHSLLAVYSSSAFTFDDIHYWIGAGTNRAAVVVDWNNGATNASIAYGVRWNGISTNLAQIIRGLDNEDRRFYSALSDESWGTWILGFAYDRDGDGGCVDMEAGQATDADDYVAVDDFSSDYYWALVRTDSCVISSNLVWRYCSSGADRQVPTNGVWFAVKRINWIVGEEANPSVPVAAESPYAYRVSKIETTPGNDYTNANAVLGSPSVCTRGWLGYTLDAPVTPPNPVWSTDQILTLAKNEDGLGGSVTIAFDHPVVDDPLNPFGLDFIVFGNAFQALGDDQYFGGPEDPAEFVFTAPAIMAEPGLVEVSQDGTNWFSFVKGPFADGFAPTMSHLYNTNSPDVSLFSGNRWWSAKADPTLPVDPTVSVTNFFGHTLAQSAQLYNGSAGGTGFDISQFDLPYESTGRKWIRYVRVTTLSNNKDAQWTDIDAFADVSPALPYDNWVRKHYAWVDQPNTNVVGKRVIAANGKPNFYNAAFGTAPDADPVETFAARSLTIENGKAIFTVQSSEFAFDAFRIGKASSLKGAYRDSLPTHEGTFETEDGFESVFSVPVDELDVAAFYKIGISAE